MEWLIVAGVVVVLGFLMARRNVAKRHTETLRRRFGPEYDRLLAESGDRRMAETRLRERTKRREALDLRGLSAESQATYKKRWRENQASFVDEPAVSVEVAAALMDELARERGYPVDSPVEFLELLSVDHPRLVERYRVARNIYQRSTEGSTTIDDLRTAFRNYRSLFNELLVDGGGAFVRYEQDAHVRETT